MGEMLNPKKISPWGCVVWSGVALALLLAFYPWPSVKKEPPQPPGQERPSSLEAWVMAQQFVEERLKSPSTASFGSVFGDYQAPDDVVAELGGGNFRVRAWVDSQNAFGATVRTHFVCEMQYLGNKKWRLVKLEFLR